METASASDAPVLNCVCLRTYILLRSQTFTLYWLLYIGTVDGYTEQAVVIGILRQTLFCIGSTLHNKIYVGVDTLA